jgi:hypothetical protein
MPFFKAKYDTWFCFGCGNPIIAGEDCYGVVNRQKGILMFHLGCYIPWVTENFNSKFQAWKIEQTEDKVKHHKRKVIGRPRKYKSIREAGRIRSLMYYYKITQQPDKVQELEQELSKLEIRREDGNS